MSHTTRTDDTIDTLRAIAANLRASREQTEALLAYNRESSRTLTAALGAAIGATGDAVQEALRAAEAVPIVPS